MTVALVVNGIVAQELGALPSSAQRQDTGQWVLGLPTADPAAVAACGWFTVVATARPADTATTTTDRSLTLVNGLPTETWTSRALTSAELTMRSQLANQATILQQARTALTANATFLAIPSPTQAQAVAQVQALTQQVNKLIRLAVQDFTATT